MSSTLATVGQIVAGILLFSLGVISGLPARNGLAAAKPSEASNPVAWPANSGLEEKRARIAEAKLQGSSQATTNLSVDEVRKLLDHARKENRYTAVSVLLSRWVDLDPESALKYAAAHQIGVARVIAKWCRQRPQAAEKAVLALSEGSTKRSALISLARTISEIQPGHAYQLLRDIANTEAEKLHEYTDKIFAKLTAGDAIGAEEQQQSVPSDYPDGAADSAMDCIMENWGRRDPLSAIAAALQTTETSSAIGSVMRGWALTDPHAALAWARSQTNSSLSHTALTSLSQTWGEKDPAAANRTFFQLQQSLPVKDRHLATAQYYALSAWIKKDLRSALAWVYASYQVPISMIFLDACVWPIARDFPIWPYLLS